MRLVSAVFFTLFFAALGPTAFATSPIISTIISPRQQCLDIYPLRLSSRDQPHFSSAVRDLVNLRVRIDQLRASGRRSANQSALEQSYRTKLREFNDPQFEGSSFRAHVTKLIAIAQKLTGSEIVRRPAPIRTDFEFYEGSKIVFHRLRAQDVTIRRFQHRLTIEKKPAFVTRDFFLAATPTTQAIWRAVVLAAKVRFPGRFPDLDPQPSYFNGDYRPVESVSHFEVNAWLQMLNALSVAQDPIVSELFENYQRGYRFRLPMEAEWAIAATNNDQLDGELFMTDRLLKHAWLALNADGETHPVSLRDPIVVDGQPFYDLYGNVYEWSFDAAYVDGNQPGFKEHRLCGGSFKTGPGSCAIPISRAADRKDETTGFRILMESLGHR